jgi:hypothetical protein
MHMAGHDPIEHLEGVPMLGLQFSSPYTSRGSYKVTFAGAGRP